MTTDAAQLPAVSRAALVDQLRALGVTAGIALVVHTSFRAVRPVADGPRGLIRALCDALGPNGTLMMPAMSGSRASDPYDPATTPAKGMGIVAETFRQLPGTLRSDRHAAQRPRDHHRRHRAPEARPHLLPLPARRVV
jgi:aminoglycoside N3'-acetyltransferase